MDYIFIAGSFFALVGAILMAKGIFLSAADTINHARSYWGYNPDLVTHLARDKADAQFGYAALIIGFFFQFAGFTAHLYQKDPTIKFLTSVNVRLFISISPIILYVILWIFFRNWLTRRYVQKAVLYLKSGNDRETVLIRAAILTGHQPSSLVGSRKLKFLTKIYGKNISKVLAAPDPD